MNVRPSQVVPSDSDVQPDIVVQPDQEAVVVHNVSSASESDDEPMLVDSASLETVVLAYYRVDIASPAEGIEQEHARVCLLCYSYLFDQKYKNPNGETLYESDNLVGYAPVWQKTRVEANKLTLLKCHLCRKNLYILVSSPATECVDSFDEDSD